MNKNIEQTLVIIKPDALKNSITGFIFSQLSELHTGARFAGAKVVNVSKLLAEEHYAEHVEKPFFGTLYDYITGRQHYSDEDKWKRRVIAITYMGPGVVEGIRALAGPTNPHNARDQKPGSIRSLGTVMFIEDDQGNKIGDKIDNLVHTSATAEEAEREIKLWFVPRDIPPMMRIYPTQICPSHYYYKDGKLYDTYEPDSMLLLAPGDMAWETDLEILQSYDGNECKKGRLNTVAAKYLVNRIDI